MRLLVAAIIALFFSVEQRDVWKNDISMTPQ